MRDNKGEPVMFATVNVKGSSKSVSADNNGYFSISATANDSLVISATGFKTKIVLVSGDILVTLEPATNDQLQEVVVTALGIQRQRKELGYSTAKVIASEINRSSPVNVANGLQGKVSGLNITTLNNGIFANVRINLRGIRSLMGNNNPMLLLDGIPTPIDYLNSINPNDIQDVNILKGAASAGLYGPDARNGVIVVTTKKAGRDGKPSIIVSQTAQMERVSFYPVLQTEFGSGAYGSYLPKENWSWGPAYDGSTRQLGPTLPDGSKQSVVYSPTDERKKFWNTGTIFQSNVSISAKDFLLSFQDAKMTSVVPGDKNRRTGVRLNTARDYGIFKASFNTNYIQQNYDAFDPDRMNFYHITYRNAGLNSGLMNLIYNTPAHIPITKFKDFENDQFSKFNNYFNDYGLNPYFALDNWRQAGKVDDLLTNIELGLKPLPYLNVVYRAALSLTSGNVQSISKGELASPFGESRGFVTVPVSTRETNYRKSRLSSELNLQFNKSYGNFKVSAIAGQYFRQSDRKEASVGAANLIIPGLYNVGSRLGELSGNNELLRSRTFGVYATAGLSYKGWANIEFTGRNDWTSVLANNNNSFFYPGVSTSFVLSDVITPLKESKTISYLKLRGNIQKTGNSDVNPYSLAAVYEQNQTMGFPYGGVIGYTADEVAYDPQLKPEFINSKEIGLEIGFFNNRVNIEAAFYHQNNTDQIIPISVTDPTGFGSYFLNAASFVNRGMEFDLKLTPLVNLGDVTVNFKANASYNDSKIHSIYRNLDRLGIGGWSIASNFAIAGQPAFVWMAIDYVRDDQGRVIVDETGLPSVDPVNKVYGRTAPLWILGFNPEISWRGLSLTATLEFKTGHYTFNGIGPDMAWTGVSAASAVNHRNPFVFPNSVYDDGTGKMVVNRDRVLHDVTDFYTNTFSDVSSNFLTSAASWRVREVSLGYNLPARWLAPLKVVKAATITLNARNLALWLPASNQYTDPDFSSTNALFNANLTGFNDSQITPPTRLFGANLTVTF
nr:SusC/RagA family TonB-linked outer membrane protein [Pseudoflavitalea rhizosphaerae]